MHAWMSVRTHTNTHTKVFRYEFCNATAICSALRDKNICKAFLFPIFIMPTAMMGARHGRKSPLTNAGVIRAIVAMTMLSYFEVQNVMDALFQIACTTLKRNGHFNFINMVRLKLKPSTLARQAIHPFTKKVIACKPKKATVKAFVLRKLKVCLSQELECRWLK